MFKRSIIPIFYFLIICCHPGQTQQIHLNKQFLDIGDTIPDLYFSSVFNFPKSSLKISDFKNKIVVLDFWNMWCAPCIAAFDYINDLQIAYGNKVQFLPINFNVTEEEKLKVEKLFSRIKSKKDFVLPTAFDSTFYHHFYDEINNKWIAQYVWIKNGRIIGFTSGKQKILKEDIDKALGGSFIKNNDWQPSILLPKDFTRSILAEKSNLNINRVLYSSIFTNFLGGVATKIYLQYPTQKDSSASFRFVNFPLSYFYMFAYQIESDNEIVFETPDSIFVQPIVRDSTNLFCYELMMSHANIEEMYKNMRNDLDRVFDYAITKEKRLTSCLILRKDPTARFHTSSEKSNIERSAFFVQLKNLPFSEFVDALRYFQCRKDIPFLIDETGIKNNVDLKVDAFLPDITKTNIELQKIGLKIYVERREMEMWVMSKKKTSRS